MSPTEPGYQRRLLCQAWKCTLPDADRYFQSNDARKRKREAQPILALVPGAGVGKTVQVKFGPVTGCETDVNPLETHCQ